MMVVITEAISMYNELDLLEAHLEESQHWVDRLVIIESPVTFTSIEKPLYFADNRKRFERFNVNYLLTAPDVFETIPETYPEEEQQKWFQVRRNNRNLNRQHHWAELCRGTDYVYVNDVDEFLAREHGPYLRELLEDKHYEYLAIRTRKFNFYVNAKGSIQSQARVARSDRLGFVPKRRTPRTTTKECGWHFTSCLFPEDLYKKYLGIYLHLGWRRDQIPSVEEIRNRMANGFEPARKTSIRGGLQEIMSRDDMSWAPEFIQSCPELFPWLDVEELVDE